VQTRNFVYDSYPGVRIGTTGTWLNGLTPTVVEYVPGTGIVHVQRTLSGLQLDEYDFAPMGLAEYAGVMLLEVTQAGSAGPVDATRSSLPPRLPQPEPGDRLREHHVRGQARRLRDWAVGRRLRLREHHVLKLPRVLAEHPYGLLQSGSNLADDPGSGVMSDAVAGFQSSLGRPAQGTSVWTGWLTVLAPDANGAGAVDRVRAWVAGRTPDKLLADEASGCQAWVKPAPSGASAPGR
jgi:hypothetical protein